MKKYLLIIFLSVVLSICYSHGQNSFISYEYELIFDTGKLHTAILKKDTINNLLIYKQVFYYNKQDSGIMILDSVCKQEDGFYKLRNNKLNLLFKFNILPTDTIVERVYDGNSYYDKKYILYKKLLLENDRTVFYFNIEYSQYGLLLNQWDEVYDSKLYLIKYSSFDLGVKMKNYPYPIQWW